MPLSVGVPVSRASSWASSARVRASKPNATQLGMASSTAAAEQPSFCASSPARLCRSKNSRASAARVTPRLCMSFMTFSRPLKLGLRK